MIVGYSAKKRFVKLCRKGELGLLLSLLGSYPVIVLLAAAGVI
jgi:hypothetical protein